MSSLPFNCRLNKGYLEARVYFHGRRYSKHFGKDCREARVAAKGWIQSLEETIRLNKLGVSEPLVRVGFSQACDLFLKHWFDNDPKRSRCVIRNTHSVAGLLKDYFKNKP